MTLLTQEEVILTSNENKIVLTNRRILMQTSTWGKAYNISIFLEDISSLETKYSSYIILIVLAILSLLAGVYMARDNGNAFIGGLVFAAAFMALWFYTRKHIISFASNGGASLNFQVEGMADDKIESFVTSVSEAKMKRVEELGA